MVNVSIKKRFVFGAIIIILIPLLVGSVITYNKVTSDFKYRAENEMVRTALDLANLINIAVKQEIRFAGAIARNPQIVSAIAKGDYEETKGNIVALYQNLGDGFESLFIIDREGTLRANAIPGGIGKINVSDRDYFIKARNGTANVSAPVVSRLTGQLIMVAAYPILSDKGEFLGIAGGTIEIDSMIRYISSVKIGNTGFPSLVDPNGRVILHPEEELLRAGQNKDYIPNTILKKIQEQETGTEEFISMGIPKIAGYAFADIPNWGIIITQDLEEIMSPARSMLYYLVFSAIVFLIASIVGFVILSGFISRPIEKTISTLTEISSKSTELVLTVNKNKTIISANQTAEKLLGVPAKELIGTTAQIDSLDGTSDDEIWTGPKNGVTWHGRARIKGTDGEGGIIRTMLAPLMDKAEHIYGYIVIGKDITRELEIEERINRVQKMESIGTLAGGIAHDFNNILSAIYGYVQLSLIHIKNRERTEQFIKKINKAVERAAELVQQILAFSRQESSNLKPLELGSVVIEAASLLKASIPSSIEIKLSINSNAVVLGDSTQLHQVILNLCTNAAHAIGNDKGMIDINLENLDIDRDFAKRHPGLSEGPHVHLTVSDSGKGIDPGIAKNIFDPFFTTKETGKGTGLGLSVAHGIISKLNGSISFYSEPGNGTTFNVILPVTDKKDVFLDDEKKKITIPQGHEKILLIDDEANIIETLNPSLESYGYSVHSFTDSEQALSEFLNNSNDYDIIVTDHTMPHMTGIDIAIKAKKQRNDIPILLCTGFIDQGIKESAHQAGISHILKKPATIKEIILAIRKIIDE